MAIQPNFDPSALSLADTNFDDAVSRAISMFNPLGSLSLGNPGVTMPNVPEFEGPMPDPNVPFNIMSVLGGQQPQDNTINPGGLRDAMGKVIGEIQTGQAKLEEQAGRRGNIKSRMYELLAKRGGLMPEQAAQIQQDPQEALIAGIIALAGKAGGARNAGASFNQFMGQRQGQIAGQNQQAQQALNQEYLRRKQELDAEFQINEMEYEDATEQITGLQKQQSDLYGEYSDLAQAQGVTDREVMKIDSRESIAMLNADAKLKQIAATNGGRLDIEKFKAANPEIMQNYNSILQTRGIDAANKYMDSVAQTPEFKNQLTKAQTAKYLADVDFTKAKTGDILAFRNPKLKEMAAKLGLIDAQTGAYRALSGLREQQAIKLIAAFDTDSTTPEEITALSRAFADSDEGLAAAEVNLAEAKRILERYDDDDDGYDAALAEVVEQTKKVSALKRYRETSKDKLEIANSKKLTSSGSGTVAPFNPIGNSKASIKGKIGN